MSQVDTAPRFWPQPWLHTGFGTAVTIDAASEMAWCIIPIRKAGNISRVHFRTGTVTTGGTNDLDVRLETVDASGQPSGTLFGANTNVAHNLADGDDNAWLRTNALTASAAVSVGDKVAVVIQNPATNFATAVINRGQFANQAMLGFPTGGGPLATNKGDAIGSCAVLEYDDGTFAADPFAFLWNNMGTTVTLTTATNPDEAALYWTQIEKATAIGWWGLVLPAAGADFNINLYENGNDTPLQTISHDGDFTSNNGASRLLWGYFAAEQLLSVGTVYRLGVVPTTASNVILRYHEVSSTYPLTMDCIEGKSTCHYSSRNRSSTTDPDAAAWTEVAHRRPQMGLIVSKADDGAGGGGGGMIYPRSMNGGLV